LIRVYTATKLRHRQRWKSLRSHGRGITFTARWPDLEKDQPSSDDEARSNWLKDEEDVRKADVVIVYAEDGDHLRGALIEAGMAIALGKTVMVVGEHPDFGTWRHHPRVVHASDLDHARSRLNELAAK
jgi:nucleoside 2-deoxyribosyltransferase